MDQIISIIVFVLATSSTACLVYMFVYLHGFRKNNLIYITGYLEKTELQKNVFQGHPFSGRWHKHWTNYTYVYRVNGQKYSVCGGIPGQGKDVPRKVTVAVQKNAPRNAMIPQFEKMPSKWGLAILLMGCAILYAAGFSLWK